MSPAIVRLDGHMSAELSEPPAERLLAGTPQLQVRNFFGDTTQQFFAGRWSATRGKWRVRYTENELCVMTAGRVIIESAGGERSELRSRRCIRGARGLRRYLGSRRGLRQDLRHLRGEDLKLPRRTVRAAAWR